MMQDRVASQVSTKVEDCHLVLERVFDAPRELVFSAYSEPEHLVHWWGPRGWTMPICELDFRQGGVWFYCFQSPDEQTKAYAKAVYQEILAPERIVYVETFTDEQGNAIEASTDRQVTLTFLEHEGKTKLICRTEFVSAEALQSLVKMGAVEGFTDSWERLHEHLRDTQ